MPRRSRRLSADRLLALARTGAEATLPQLRAEIAMSRRFRSWRYLSDAVGPRRSLKTAGTRTREMSAAARKAIERMKRYWEERRKAQAKTEDQVSTGGIKNYSPHFEQPAGWSRDVRPITTKPNS